MGDTGKTTVIHLHFSLQKFNVKKQDFEYTDPSIIINNKIQAEDYSLYDYDNNGYKNQFEFNNDYSNFPKLDTRLNFLAINPSAISVIPDIVNSAAAKI